MEFTPEAFERAVCHFYEGDMTVQAQAHDWLKKAKNSPEAWAFVWDLLQPQKKPEVQFFAASTLHLKIKKSLNEIPSENVIPLRDKLLATIIEYNAGPKIVLNKLCVSLSAYLMQTCPETWPDALPSLLSAFTPETLPHIPVKGMICVLLEILIVLPEEFSCVNILQHQKGLLRHHFNENMPSIMSLLEKLLTGYSDEEVILQVVKCALSWITVGFPISEYHSLSNVLVNLVFSTYKLHPDICEKTLECLKAIVDQPENYEYPLHLLEFLTKILPLREIIARELSSSNSVDQDLVTNIYNLFLTFGGAQSRHCLNWIKQGGDARLHVMTLVTSILQCSGASGYYPVDETYSKLAFGFWCILQDEITASSNQEREVFLKDLGPIYKELLNILITKAQLPDADKNFTEEDVESFRCYRQDISDTLMYCQKLFHKSTLRLIHSKLEKINMDETRWQELEACIFSLGSISEVIELDENEYLPRLFQYITSLPFQRLEPKVLSTALDTIGAYADWISAHSSTLEYILPLIMLGLNVPETTSSATMALKDLARDCQYNLKPYSSLILDASQKALHGGRLRLNDSQRLMYTVGILLSVLPMDTIMYYLNLILTPYLDQLDSLAQQQPSPQVKNSIFLCLKMVGVLSACLNTKFELNPHGLPTNLEVQNNEPQPVLIILQKLFPVIKVIANSWSSDEQVMQSLFSVLKCSVSTLREDAHSVVPEILDLIVSTYRAHPQPAPLDVGKILSIVFGKDEKCEEMMQFLSRELCSITMTKLSSARSLSDHSDLLDSLFVFLTLAIRRTPKLIICAEPVCLFQCATVTVGIPEFGAVKSAANFLVNFITRSRDNESLMNVVNTYGQQLVLQLISCIAGEASRSKIEPLAQIFLALSRNYIENHSRWLRHAVDGNTCPRTSSQQRESFISALLTQRNKTNLQETVRKFSLICRGMMGTEYGESASPFI